MKRFDAVREVMAGLDTAMAGREPLVVVCNGMIGREVYTVGDRPRHFYMIGSMGLALSIGHGLAIAQPDRPVVVLDGDGNVLMGMGVLATVGALRPANLWHVIFDNEAHGSTGDQRTVTERVWLDDVARASGYAYTARSVPPYAPSVREAAIEAFGRPGPAALLVKVEKGNQHGIARVAPEPPELAARFRAAALEAAK